MKILLDIKESKVLFFMELLNNFPFVKIQPFTNEKKLFLQKVANGSDAFVGIEESTPKKIVEEKLFAETFGMWAGRDIDIKKIRKERRERRTKYYDNATL